MVYEIYYYGFRQNERISKAKEVFTMMFYKVTGVLPETEQKEQEKNPRGFRRMERNKTLQILQVSDEFNEKIQDSAYCFVADINGAEIICGIAVWKAADISSLSRSFSRRPQQRAAGIISGARLRSAPRAQRESQKNTA